MKYKSTTTKQKQNCRNSGFLQAKTVKSTRIRTESSLTSEWTNDKWILYCRLTTFGQEGGVSSSRNKRSHRYHIHSIRHVCSPAKFFLFPSLKKCLALNKVISETIIEELPNNFLNGLEKFRNSRCVELIDTGAKPKWRYILYLLILVPSNRPT